MPGTLKKFALITAVLGGGMIGGALSRPADAQGQGGVTIASPIPLPVTGTVNAAQSGPWSVDINGTPTVTGNVNANVINPITGTVSVSSLPTLRLSLPAEPFSADIELTTSGSGTAKAVGVTGRRLGVTTVTISNFDSARQQLFLFNPVMSGSSCTGSVIGGASPQTQVILEPSKTIQLEFPTPAVYSVGGLGCIAAEVTTGLTGGSVTLSVTGFSAP